MDGNYLVPELPPETWRPNEDKAKYEHGSGFGDNALGCDVKFIPADNRTTPSPIASKSLAKGGVLSMTVAVGAI